MGRPEPHRAFYPLNYVENYWVLCGVNILLFLNLLSILYKCLKMISVFIKIYRFTRVYVGIKKKVDLIRVCVKGTEVFDKKRS